MPHSWYSAHPASNVVCDEEYFQASQSRRPTNQSGALRLVSDDDVRWHQNFSKRACETVWQRQIASMPNSSKEAAFAFTYHQGTFYQGSSTLLVRLGKTGGLTLRHLFAQIKIPVDMIHTRPAPMPEFDRHQRIIMSLRDPVARFVATYNSAYAMNTLSASLRQYRTVSNMTEVLLRHLAHTTPSGCPDHAQTIFSTMGTWAHEWTGICFYFGGLLSVMRSKPVFVLTTEALSSDVEELLAWLSLQDVHGKYSYHLENGHQSSTDPKDKLLSQTARRALEFEFASEYRMLNRAMQNSVNKRGTRYCTSAVELPAIPFGARGIIVPVETANAAGPPAGSFTKLDVLNTSAAQYASAWFEPPKKLTCA
jgi:hypothetical protein